MNYGELKTKLEKADWFFVREGKGSHKIFKHPQKTIHLSVPYHGSKDIPIGTLNKILKQAGLK